MQKCNVFLKAGAAIAIAAGMAMGALGDDPLNLISDSRTWMAFYADGGVELEITDQNPLTVVKTGTDEADEEAWASVNLSGLDGVFSDASHVTVNYSNSAGSVSVEFQTSDGHHYVYGFLGAGTGTMTIDFTAGNFIHFDEDYEWVEDGVSIPDAAEITAVWLNFNSDESDVSGTLTVSKFEITYNEAPTTYYSVKYYLHYSAASMPGSYPGSLLHEESLAANSTIAANPGTFGAFYADGYMTDGKWYIYPFGTEFVFGTGDGATKVTGNMNLYLIWEAAKYTVSFNLNGGKGTTPADITGIENNGTVSASLRPGVEGIERPGFTNDGRWYTRTFVEAGAREITVLMFDADGDGWNNSGKMRILVNGTERAQTGVTSGSSATYRFSVNPGDNVEFRGFTGNYKDENAFIAYYTDTPLRWGFYPYGYWDNDVERMLAFWGAYSWSDSYSSDKVLAQFTATGENGSGAGEWVYTEFVFGSTRVNANTTLYLKWSPAATTKDITAKFVDENFRDAVTAALGLAKGSPIYDVEAAALTALNASGKKIKNTAGLECLTGLTSLNVSQNQLTTVNVTGLSKLVTLDVSKNFMSGEDKVVGLNRELTTAFTFAPQYVDIKASFTDPIFRAKVYRLIGKPAGDPIIETDVNAITTFTLGSDATNGYVTSLAGIENFVELTSLNASGNALTSADLSKNVKLTSLDVSSNKLTSLNVTANVALTYLNAANNRLTAINVGANVELTSLYVQYNNLTGLNVAANTKLTSLDVGGNNLTAINLATNTALTYLSVGTNKLSALSLTTNTALVTLYCHANALTALNVDANTALTTLQANDNQLTTLNVAANTALTNLRVDNNHLGALNVSANTALTRLIANDNRLATIDLTTNTALNVLDVRNNIMTEEAKVVGKDAAWWDANKSDRKFWKQNIAYTLPEKNEEYPFTAVFGQKLSSVKLPAGWKWYDAEAQVGTSAGVFSHSAVFTAAANPDASKFNGTALVNLAVTVTKANVSASSVAGLTAISGQTLASVALPAGWAWVNAETPVGAAGVQTHNATFAGDTRYNAATAEAPVGLKVSVQKATATFTRPAGLTGVSGQPLSSVVLPEGWSWVNGDMTLGVAGTHNYAANFVPEGEAQNAAQNVSLTVTVTAGTVSNSQAQKSGKYGILLKGGNIVSQPAEAEIVLPEGERVISLKAVIYDNTGNTVFSKETSGARFTWDLKNISGRNVANGAYLIIVEATGVKGTYAYSAKIGVKR